MIVIWVTLRASPVSPETLDDSAIAAELAALVAWTDTLAAPVPPVSPEFAEPTPMARVVEVVLVVVLVVVICC